MRRVRLPTLGRRRVLQWAGGATGALALPNGWVLGCSSSSSSSPSYFSEADASVLNALADAVIPPDDAPGGSSLGVIEYASQLLTAFDSNPPLIYAGGPFSGREAEPTSTGTPSSTFPPDEFSTFLALDRVQTKAWQLRIFGSSGVPGGGPNDAITGPVIGLREAIATAISEARAAMPPNVAVSDLTQAQKTTMLGSLDKTTLATLIELVLEAAFTAPEYGGNPEQAGWKMVYFEGDSQPLGYSWYDTQSKSYSEDPSHPVSMPNPGADPMPLDPSTEMLLGTIIGLLGGKTFG
jgi:Gluconate 2-dehydrogenase subunit 3